MTVRDALKMLHQDGWQIHRQRGSHRQLKHPEKPGTLTVAGNAGSEIERGTLRNIFAQAGIEWPPRID